MDKTTLSQYGWIIIISLALSALFVLATPLGTGMADSVVALIRGTTIFSNEAYSDDSIKEQTDYMENLFDYSDALQPGLYMHKDAATQAFTWEEYVNNSYINLINGRTSSTSKTHLTNGDLIMGNDVRIIGTYTFSSISSLYVVKLGVATEVIEQRAFNECVNLEIFRSNKHLKQIGNYAFRNNYNLKVVYLENELETIGTEAFYNCYKLTEIHYNGTISEWNSIAKSTSGNSWYPNSLEKIICQDGEIAI